MVRAPAAEASAPGKVILFGEHSVVYGEPSISLALNRRTRVQLVQEGARTLVNGEPVDAARHAYLQQALRLCWDDRPLRLRTESELPSAAGVGSSAALSVAAVAGLLRLAGGRPPEPSDVARGAFETELATQGLASPNDTTVATAGGAVLLSPERLPVGQWLWRIEKGNRSWNAHRLATPRLPLVVGNSGARGRTSEQVAKVRRFVEHSGFARDIVREMGRIAMEAVDAVRAGDLARLGSLMNRNHECLHTLGVDTPQLEAMVETARKVRGTYGAKLTGAGGGGSMVALTQDPPRVKTALEGLGVHAFIVESSAHGFEVTQ